MKLSQIKKGLRQYLLSALESIGSILELVFLDEASAGDLRVGSTKFGVAILSWDKSSVFWDGV